MKALVSIKPFSVSRLTAIEGQNFPLHEFTSESWSKIVKPIREPESDESVESAVDNSLNLVIAGLEGADYAPTKDDREQIKTLLPNGVIREYIHRLCQLNDFGIDAVRAAEKNYAAVQSDDTK